MLKILLLDKNLIDVANHSKWQVLAGKKDVILHGVGPETWVENSRVVHVPNRPSSAFSSESLPVFWPGYENRGFYTAGLRKAFLRVDPDVVVCFEEPCSLFALQALLLVRLLKPSCKLVYYSWYNLDPHRFIAYRPFAFYRIVLHLTLSRADLVLCANQEGLTFYRNRVGDRAKALWFSVEQDRFRPPSVDAPPPHRTSGSFTIGYVGRLLEMKSVETLVDAFALVGRGKQWKLSILGNGPDRAMLERRVNDHGISEQTRIEQGVVSKEVPMHLRGLDVLVLPSKTTRFWKEQFGRVIIEAFSAGVVVVGSDSGAIPDVIADAGLVFPETDAAALADHLLRLSSDQALFDRLRKKGFERARHFTPDRFAETLHGYLIDLLNEQEPRL